MPSENIRTVAQLEREIVSPDDKSNAQIVAVLQAIKKAAADVAHRVNSAKVYQVGVGAISKVSAPHRATAVHHVDVTGISEQRLTAIVADICGTTKLATLDVGNRALYHVAPALKPGFDTHHNRPYAMYLQRVEELPDDDEERREAIKALKLLQFAAPYRHRGATHVVWTLNPLYDVCVDPQLLDAKRVAPLSMLSVPQARRHDRPLAEIVARTMLLHGREKRRLEERQQFVDTLLSHGPLSATERDAQRSGEDDSGTIV